MPAGHTRRERWRALDPQLALLLGVLCGLAVIWFFLGRALSPFFAAMILAYLMDGPVRQLERRRVPRIVAVICVFGLFLLICLAVFVWLLPLLTKQLTQLVSEVPRIVTNLQSLISGFQERYLSGLESQYVQNLLPRLAVRLEAFVGKLAGQTLSFIPGLLSLILYTILVPFLVFFFLKDKKIILEWLVRFLPGNHELLFQVLKDMDRQMGNLIRGKSLEILIMTVASLVTFQFLGIKYAVLLGILTGLSTLVPYLGVAVVTVPVLLLSLVQWGPGVEMVKTAVAYGVLQLVDGNVLAPLILGSSVRVHPAAIVFAILVCGALWGFWGVVFAVPLASLCKSLLDLAFPHVIGSSEPKKGEESDLESVALDG